MVLRQRLVLCSLLKWILFHQCKARMMSGLAYGSSAACVREHAAHKAARHETYYTLTTNLVYSVLLLC